MNTNQDRKISGVLLLISLLTLGLLLFAAYDENYGSDWHRHQSEYKRILIARANSEVERKGAERFQVSQKQIYLPHLNSVDRCVSCHVAVDDPAMADAPQPLAAHPGDIMRNHPKEQFGCVLCHQGQGRATNAVDAHGPVPHWLSPMLETTELEQSCAMCHTEKSLPNAPRYSRAMGLFIEKGCLYCHKLRGQGGDIGPDITAAGLIHDAEWHFKHFKDPKSVVATSEMPNMALSDDDAHALTFLMMSLKGSSIPTDLLSSAKPKPTNVDLNAVDPQAARGYVGSRVCLGCHESLTPETVDAWKTSPMANTFSRIKDESEKLSCLKCHATGLNPTTGHYSEESVGCEGCHGPGREAVEFVLKGRVDEHKKRLHLDVNSKLVCISCHDPHEPLEGHPARHRRQSQTGSK